MWSPRRTPWTAGRWPAAVAMLCTAIAGCKSDLSQQLLERELRYQEDQIYQLQDELQDTCSRLDMLSGENASLRKQLGVSPGDSLSRSRAGSPRSSPPAGGVPPALEIPERIPAPATPAQTPLAPPTLDNIPPLPVRPSAISEPAPLDLPPPADAAATRPAPVAVPATAPVAVPVTHEQRLADSRPVRLVMNAATTACFDDNGDGLSDGMAVTFEPRNAAEKLVPAPGEVSITVFDAADPVTPLASWSIPAEQAAGHFRPTTRLRGMHFPLRWTGSRPSGDHVRVAARVTGPEGAVLETDATVPVR
ncbi:MAG: hypothetical protein ACKO4T_05360 [Planctomycetaceae bacterium]